MSRLTVALLAGGAAAGSVLAVAARRRPPARVLDLRAHAGAGEAASTTRVVPAFAGQVVMALGARLRRWGGRPPDAAADARVGLACVAGAVGALVHPLVGAVGFAVMWAAPLMVAHRRRERDRRQLVDGLADVVDLCRLGAGAGLTAALIVEALADRLDPPFADAFAEVRRRVALGLPLADALGHLRSLGDPVLSLCAVLTSAARDGAALLGPLDRVADEARQARRRAAEQRARRLPVQLLFPLVLCILPSFGLLTVAPVLAGTLRSLTS